MGVAADQRTDPPDRDRANPAARKEHEAWPGLKPVDDKNLEAYGAPITRGTRPRRAARRRSGRNRAPARPVSAPTGAGWSTTDGMPHVVPVGAFWEDGAFYFTSGEGTRKSRNLARNPRCNISFSGDGLDLVVEGEAEKVKDEPTLERLAKIAREGGWPATVENGALTAPFSAPSAGPPPWELYPGPGLPWISALGNSSRRYPGATRWRF